MWPVLANARDIKKESGREVREKLYLYIFLYFLKVIGSEAQKVKNVIFSVYLVKLILHAVRTIQHQSRWPGRVYYCRR